MSSNQIRPTATQLNQDLEDHLRRFGFEDGAEDSSFSRPQDQVENGQDDQEDGGIDWPSSAKILTSKPPKLMTKSEKLKEIEENKAQKNGIKERGKGKGEQEQVQEEENQSQNQKHNHNHPSTFSSTDTTTPSISVKPKQKVLRFAPTVQSPETSRANAVGSDSSSSPSTSSISSTSKSRPPSRFAQQRAAATLKAESQSNHGVNQVPVEEAKDAGDERIELDSEGKRINIPPIPRGPSVIGGVKERAVPRQTSNSSTSGKDGRASSSSSNRGIMGSILERNLDSKDDNPLGYSGFPIVSNINASNLGSNESDPQNQKSRKASSDVWLDEDGEPMSAFRKSRLIKQGLGPPSRNQTKVDSNLSDPTPSNKVPSVLSSLSRPIKERGVDVDVDVDPNPNPNPRPNPNPNHSQDASEAQDEIATMLKSVSEENDEKLKRMGKEELENELKSVQSLFSEEILEMLKRRGEEKSGSENSIDPKSRSSRMENSDANESHQDASRDPGGGADPLAISQMLQSVSKENEQKLRNMDQQEIEQERASLENLFGSEVLDQLKKRREGRLIQDQGSTEVGNERNKNKSSERSSFGSKSHQEATAPRDNSSDEGLECDEFEGSSKDIKTRFFPQESESHPSLEWMSRSTKLDSRSHSSIRFDFNGARISQDVKSSKDKDLTYLAGLHHHGKDQSSPGYTLEELLHLSRSSVASQRSLAFSVLGRICIKYPSVRFVSKNAESEEFHISRTVDEERLRPKLSIIAKISLEDRQRNVSIQALGSLRAAIISDYAGPEPVPGFDSSSFIQSSSKTDNQPASKQNSTSQVPNDDWIAHLIQTGLIRSLSSLAPRSRIGSLDSSSSEDQTVFLTLLDILSVLASRSIEACDMIMQEKALLDMIVGRGIKPPWPPSQSCQPSSVPAPNPSAVKLIGILAASSRFSAERLVYEGSIESLMRILTFFPWMMEDQAEASDQDKSGEMEWRLLKNTLEVYTLLGNYGMLSSIYMRIATLLTPMRDSVGVILRQAIEAIVESNETHADLIILRLQVIKHLLLLLEVWTISVSDPDFKGEDGRVVWQQVSDWSDLSSRSGPIQSGLESFSLNSRELPESEISILRSILGVVGASIRHFSAYIKASAQWKPTSTQDLESSVPDFKNFGSLASFISGDIPRLSQAYLESRSKSEPFWFQSQATAQALSDLCQSGASILSLKVKAQETAPENVIKHMLKRTGGLFLKNEIWQDFERAETKICGIQVLRRPMVGFIISSLPSFNQIVRSPRLKTEEVGMALSILGILQSGDEEIAQEIITNLLQMVKSMIEELQYSISSPKLDVQSLIPFFKESLRPASDQDGNPTALTPPLQPTYQFLRSSQSLFFRASESTLNSFSNSDGDEEDEEKSADPRIKADLDPLTGAPLWKSSASGLPIRKDWPLLAIDDLLESADSAALNRSGNLPSDWNSSEEEIVRSSLALSIVIFESALSSTIQSTSKILPSSSEIFFALMKIYKLEESSASAPGSKATGTLTGKDLFREPSIAKMISRLICISNQISSYSSSSSSTLETTSLKYLPETVPFYQFYTDLLGLYDSISFGDPSFGQLVLLPISMRYPKDYRKLFWVDYSSSLRTISTKVHDLPSETGCGIQDFLEPVEVDDEILKSYLNSLVNIGIEEDGNEALYNIALHHLIRNIWSEPSGEVKNGVNEDIHKSRYLARTLLTSTNSKLRVDSLLYDGRRSGKEKRSGLKRFGKDDEQVKKRLSWIAKNLGENHARELRELSVGMPRGL